MIKQTPYFIISVLLAGCAGTPEVVRLGWKCQPEMDPVLRLEFVREIMASGDEQSIPVLIDCLAAAKRYGKAPDRVYRAKAIVPNDTAPPEFWGLHVLTGQDFDLDLEKWGEWYDRNRGKLQWDGGRRRFIPK